MKNSKPFIHLFRSTNYCYFFDVNTNHICRIDEDIYYYLEKEQNDIAIQPEEMIKKKINALKNNGLLSNNRTEKILHPQDKFLEYRLENYVQKVTLQVTQNCNFRCSYCIYSEQINPLQRSHSNKRMSWGTAKKAIDFLIAHSSEKDIVDVGFYGGEPLLEFGLIKKCIEYCNIISESKKITFHITTNGTIVNNQIIEFLIENDVDLMISLDGPSEIHDKQRRFKVNGCGSFDAVFKNLKIIEDKYPQYSDKITINCVINPKNNYKCLSNFFTYNDIFKNKTILFNIMSEGYGNKRHLPSKEYYYSSAYEIFKVFLCEMGLLKEKKVSAIAKMDYNKYQTMWKSLDSINPIKKTDHPNGPCLPGTSRLFIDVDGNFFPCERVSELSSIMNIGNLEEGFRTEHIRKLLNLGQTTEDECKNCWAFRYCNACLVASDNMDNLSKELRLSYCRIVKKELDEALRSKVLMDEMKTIYKEYIY